MSLALEGIRVIEVAQYAAAPMGGRLLADLGADVIHIENPITGDAHRNFQSKPTDVIKAGRGVPSNVNYNWELNNINKRSLTLDLGKEEGKKVFYRLIEKADVFSNNLRPYEIEKFQLDYATLSKINPGLIHASLTGYGKRGPERDSPGFDIISYWARTAIPYLLDAQGFRPATGDNLGGLMLAFGIMTALFVRERTGIGQELDMSLFATGIYQMSFDISGALIEKKEFTEFKLRGREDSFNPLTGGYLTKDGRQFLLMCLQPDRYWPLVCRAIGREDLVKDARFATFEARARNRMELFGILDTAFAGKTLAEWRPLFTEIPSAPVQNLLEVVDDPQARANDYYVKLDHPIHGLIEVVAPPVKFSKTPATVRKAAPEFNQHTEEILLEYGYTWEEISRLREQNVIA
ncbi:MAG: CoA transferase [Dehalococcoidia bacterium]|nr:CoA transferase [Dehalococcoidia bacterium]